MSVALISGVVAIYLAIGFGIAALQIWAFDEEYEADQVMNADDPDVQRAAMAITVILTALIWPTLVVWSNIWPTMVAWTRRPEKF